MSSLDGKDSATRKAHPVFSGVLLYFPDALLSVAELSRIGNDKHNPGQPLHWSRGKSNDHGDCLVRHQLDAGKWDEVDIGGGKTAKVRHSAEVAWRALAQLQLEIEADAAQEALNEAVPVPVIITATYGGPCRRSGDPGRRSGADVSWDTLARACDARGAISKNGTRFSNLSDRRIAK